MFKHIVLATDGSPSAAKASQTAIDLARVHGAKITAAFVIDPYPYMSLGEDSGEAFQAYMNAAHATSLKVTGELEQKAKQAAQHRGQCRHRQQSEHGKYQPYKAAHLY